MQEYLLKLAIVGTETIEREKVFRKEEKNDDSELLGVDITTEIINLKDKEVKLIVVDTRGDKKFENLRPRYYKGAKGILIVFSYNNRKSFEEIPQWIREIGKHHPEDLPKICLIGIKGGKEVICREEVEFLIKEYQFSYYEYNKGEKKEKIFRRITDDVF